MLDAAARYRPAVLSVSEQLPDPPQHAVLLWIVGMVLAGDLKHCRKRFLKLLDIFAYHLGNLYIMSCNLVVAWFAYMLIDQDNADVFAFLCKSPERICDLRLLCLVVHDQKVALGVGWFCDVAHASEEETCD
jgi:hypothetical protein